jgi:perosamine synthetase
MLDEIPLSQPDITDAEIEAVVDTLRSGRLALGPRTAEFESLVAERTGRRYGVAVSSGTAGLHLSMLALGIGPGDEVITTPLSFIASANCILYMGATPVFVDVDPHSMNMDPQRVADAVTEKTKAIVAVETFGNPAHMDEYRAIAAKYELPLIEDCCEALGGMCNGTPCGGFGRVGVFGFYPNKQITTGEGGMIVTDDDRLAETCRSLRNQGRRADKQTSRAGGSSWLMHERVGYNYRMSELSAALGVVQMRRLDELLERRSQVATTYLRRLMSVSEVVLPNVDPDTVMSWFVFVLRLSDEYTREERDRILAGMRRHDIGVGDYFPCIHLQPPYRERFGFKEGDFPIAERLCARTIALPFHTRLTEREISFVAQTLELMISRENLSRP